MADTEDNCNGPRADPFEGSIGLRIGAIFIIWASSTAITLFPILTKRVSRFNIPASAFDFAKYFGSGVIIATAFIHLLDPGIDELSSPCLNSNFQNYPFALAFAMISLFLTFIVEFLAFRFGSSLANRLAYDPHSGGHHHASEHVTSGHNEKSSEEGALAKKESSDSAVDLEKDQLSLSAQAQEILGVVILEFGVVFHSFIIGITLGTTEQSGFVQLFIVIIFHQMFEGLGLGSRLAFLPLQMKTWIPTVGALTYGLVTPIGLAIGIGVRNTYNGDGATANYVTGIFDSFSAGILLYTGTVELLAHEFIFNDKMRKAPISKVIISIVEMMTGAGIMALLGKWA
ncbi:putative ZRT2-zinc transporter II [Violaceomyces palustris]|uniref:ZRT2-zinc transporter II n=1 Tax=Violaceomyces palustris TaxID=1673888 RepID=A0ACD0P6X7_9BASI|nr:putative ZRT2-zinc transporter II [Violaceomyces palustris]